MWGGGAGSCMYEKKFPNVFYEKEQNKMLVFLYVLWFVRSPQNELSAPTFNILVAHES